MRARWASRCSPAKRKAASTTVLLDAANGTMKPLYNYMNDLPSISGTPPPFLPRKFVRRTLGNNTSFDAGRGCPFQCSFCTIINVQGRKSRYRSPDDIEAIVRLNWAQKIYRFFITDDNFARNKDWEAIFDRLAKLREVDGIPLGLMIQVDTMCHKIPRFIEKAKRAGVTRVFIGLENINPDNLVAAKKKQNKIAEYRKMLLAWKDAGHLHLRRLHPRLPRRYAGIDPPRHRDNPARIAARCARVLHPDAAAGLRGPQGALDQEGRHGPRPQQIRPRTRGHRPPEDDAEGAASHLPARLGRAITRASTSRRCCAGPLRWACRWSASPRR